MRTEPAMDRCLAYINCENQPRVPKSSLGRRFRAVTISRQCGSGGHSVAEILAKKLQEADNHAGCPWTVFDKNLVEKVLEDHNLPARLARYMPEDKMSEISDTMDELFGLHPPSWSLVRKVSETILRLAERGNVIIIGRAANAVTGGIDSVLHVRLVGSEERRAEYLKENRQLGSRRAALELLRKEDKARERYLKKYFDKSIEDPLLYHLTINTDLISHHGAAHLVAQTVLEPGSSL